MRIIFFGTPDFAVASLKALFNAGFNIVAVVTAPDKPAGRGQQMQESAVKKYALQNQLKVLQPEKLKDENFIKTLQELNADLQVIVAFRMLPEVVWDMPKFGTINLHASLLPQYRGAAPINWAIINGEKESGVSTFFLQHQIDTGNIILKEALAIADDDTAGSYHDKLMETGAKLLIKTVKAVQKDDVKEIPQDTIAEKNLKHAPKLFKADCEIKWDKPAREIYNKIRGLSPYPAAFTIFNSKTLKIFSAKVSNKKSDQIPGAYKTDGKNYLSFATADVDLEILELQLEGKKRMIISEFLRGFKP